MVRSVIFEARDLEGNGVSLDSARFDLVGQM